MAGIEAHEGSGRISSGIRAGIARKGQKYEKGNRRRAGSAETIEGRHIRGKGKT